MAQPYVGEIRMFGGNFAPCGWAFCDGQLLPIDENETLFNLIGTTYGGNGQTTFALPDLRSRVPLHQNPGSFVVGQASGVESVTLNVQQIPSHNHTLSASLNNAGSNTVTNNVTGQVGASQIYREVPPGTAMSTLSIVPAGGSGAHTNIQPCLTISFIISLFGIWPSPN